MTLHHTRLVELPNAGAIRVAASVCVAGGLTQAEMGEIAHAIGPCWCMMPHQDVDGEYTAMVMPADDDPALPTWVVHREGTLLRLDVCRDDSYSRIGAYAALPPLLTRLKAWLAMSDGH